MAFSELMYTEVITALGFLSDENSVHTTRRIPFP